MSVIDLAKITVKVLRDDEKAPMHVEITKGYRRPLKVDFQPAVGFILEGSRRDLPTVGEIISMIYQERLSSQKEVDCIQAEDNTLVTATGTSYELVKVLGVYLSESRTVTKVAASTKNDSGSATKLKVTSQVSGGSEETILEESTTSMTEVVFTVALPTALHQYVILRVYLNAQSGAVIASNQQFTAFGDLVTELVHAF